jgi:hypothetical protein
MIGVRRHPQRGIHKKMGSCQDKPSNEDSKKAELVMLERRFRESHALRMGGDPDQYTLENGVILHRLKDINKRMDETHQSIIRELEEFTVRMSEKFEDLHHHVQMNITRLPRQQEEKERM